MEKIRITVDHDLITTPLQISIPSIGFSFKMLMRFKPKNLRQIIFRNKIQLEKLLHDKTNEIDLLIKKWKNDLEESNISNHYYNNEISSSFDLFNQLIEELTIKCNVFKEQNNIRITLLIWQKETFKRINNELRNYIRTNNGKKLRITYEDCRNLFEKNKDEFIENVFIKYGDFSSINPNQMVSLLNEIGLLELVNKSDLSIINKNKFADLLVALTGNIHSNDSFRRPLGRTKKTKLNGATLKIYEKVK